MFVAVVAFKFATGVVDATEKGAVPVVIVLTNCPPTFKVESTVAVP